MITAVISLLGTLVAGMIVAVFVSVLLQLEEIEHPH